MSIKKIRYLTRVLLLLYVGYFGCVSYFVHRHTYKGVVYIHSHPYKKSNPPAENEPPFETHKHTAAGFFTLNQLSNSTSFEADISSSIERVDNVIIDQHIESCVEIDDMHTIVLFRHRAPPLLFLS